MMDDNDGLNIQDFFIKDVVPHTLVLKGFYPNPDNLDQSSIKVALILRIL